MNRTCFDQFSWLRSEVVDAVKSDGMGAHDILFGPLEDAHGNPLDSCLFDALAHPMALSYPVETALARSRAFAVTKYNGSAEEVEAILSL